MKLNLNKDTIKWKDVQVFLFFVALAFGFWMLQYSKGDEQAGLLNQKTAMEDKTIAKDSIAATKSEEMTEKRFELPLVCHNLPDSLRVRFFPSSVIVVCRLTVAEYRQITEQQLEIGVDYYDLMQKTEASIAPVLFRKPEGLVELTIIPETVEYLIEEKQIL